MNFTEKHANATQSFLMALLVVLSCIVVTGLTIDVVGAEAEVNSPVIG